MAHLPVLLPKVSRTCEPLRRISMIRKLVVCLFILTLITTVLTSNAEAKGWKAFKEVVTKTAAIVGIGYMADKVIDEIEELEDDIISITYNVADAVTNFFTKSTCSDCGVTYDVTFETINNGGYHPNCIAR